MAKTKKEIARDSALLRRRLLKRRGWTKAEIAEYELNERSADACMALMYKFSDAAYDAVLDAAVKNRRLTEKQLRKLATDFDNHKRLPGNSTR